jgi:hypothetical protein
MLIKTVDFGLLALPAAHPANIAEHGATLLLSKKILCSVERRHVPCHARQGSKSGTQEKPDPNPHPMILV